MTFAWFEWYYCQFYPRICSDCKDSISDGYVKSIYSNNGKKMTICKECYKDMIMVEEL